VAFLLTLKFMIEDKDFIVKELKKAIQALAKLVNLYKEEKYIDISSYDNQDIDLSKLENLFSHQDKINQKEFEFAKTILLAQYYKLKALQQVSNKNDYDILFKKWNILLELTITKSETFDFELMNFKDELNLLH